MHAVAEHGELTGTKKMNSHTFAFWRQGVSVSGLLILVLALAGQSADAAEPFALKLDGGARPSELNLAVGKSQIIQSPRRLGQVVVGDPSIADIKLLSSTQVLILGKKAGQTNLAFRDANKRVIALMEVAVGYDVAAIKQKIFQVMPNETGIEVRSANDSVLLSGEASNALAMDTALAIARSYAGKNVINLLQVGGGQQVLLEARIAEISRNSLKDLGIEANYGDPSLNGLGNAIQAGTPPAGSDFAAGLGTGSLLANAFGAIAFLDNKFFLRLSALEKRGLAKTLAEPNLVALSGQEASFLVGGEFPVPVVQSGSLNGAITVDFKEFGVGLKFTPTVLASDKINLKLTAEVSAIDAAVSSQVSGVTVPGVTTRRAGTTIELADGQSFAIAGLLQNDINNVVNQFPGLGDLPVLGALFRSTDFQRKESELAIVITAHLVKPARGGSLTLPTDGFVPPNDIDQYLKGDLEGRRAPASGAAKPAGGMEGAYGHQL
jgi:pilus assembly protein CpaC